MIKNKYSSIIYEYVQKVKSTFGNELDMILVIGSSCSGKVIENWSDIDVILVFEKINCEIIEKLKCISNLYDVKIGTTIYDKEEFYNKRIDPKTYYHLYLLQNNEIEIQYLKDTFCLPVINSEELKKVHQLYLNERMHIFKRYFLYENLTKQQIRDLYKSIYILMKIILIIDGYYPKNYEEVFKLYSEKYDFDLFDYETFINCFKENNEDYKDQLLSSSKKLLKKLYN